MQRLLLGLFVVFILTAGCSGIESPPPAATPLSQTPTAESPSATPTVETSQTPTSEQLGSPTHAVSPSRTQSVGPSTTQTRSATPPKVRTHSQSASRTPTDHQQPSVTPATDDSGATTVSVIRVVDGDTLTIQYQNGSEDTVRLLGVDTPEVHVENTPDEWEGVPDTEAGKQCLRDEGDDASDYVTSRLHGETVQLQFDETEGRRGYYGRLLAYVYLDGEHVNYQLVADGYARVYDSSFEKRERFYAAEDEAQHQELGAWRCRTVATPTPTASGGGDSGQLSVSQVHADADGNDHENENDEYIVFKNTGESALDLSGWTVSDEADHTYTVPSGFTLAAGATVTLYTGSGQDTSSELYWGSDAAIWNNGGDTIYVRTEAGQQVISYSYS